MNGEKLPGEDAFGRLSRKDAAKVLGYAESTLANWCVSGFGPKAHKSGRGGKVFYLASDIRNFALSDAA